MAERREDNRPHQDACQIRHGKLIPISEGAINCATLLGLQLEDLVYNLKEGKLIAICKKR